ncbi:MAG: 4Fe-4S dicluster domain-containing protein [Clostridia bacterium]|nr:4Fe-4S dicluster domain-containing protein [Clostridia bacterium]
MSKILIIAPKKCIGCKTCEVVCSFGKTMACNPKNAAVTVHDYEEVGIAVPMMCMQCEDAACMKVCPVSALTRDEEGVVNIDFDNCIGCKMCISACPFGNVSFNSENKKIVKCDTCIGEAKCAEFCPSKAIEFIEATGLNMANKEKMAQKFKEVFEEV